MEQYFPAGGYIAHITVYLRFEPAKDPSVQRVRLGLTDTRLAEYVCFGRQILPVAADFTVPQSGTDHARSFTRSEPRGPVRRQDSRQPLRDHRQRAVGSGEDPADIDSWSRFERRGMA